MCQRIMRSVYDRFTALIVVVIVVIVGGST